jgi:hypothetical protein
MLLGVIVRTGWLRRKFAEREWATEHGWASEAPTSERGGNRQGPPKPRHNFRPLPKITSHSYRCLGRQCAAVARSIGYNGLVLPPLPNCPPGRTEL